LQPAAFRASSWRSRFCSWVETLAYPINIAHALRRSFSLPTGQSHKFPACGPVARL
jgi:hypothetical protein